MYFNLYRVTALLYIRVYMGQLWHKAIEPVCQILYTYITRAMYARKVNLFARVSHGRTSLFVCIDTRVAYCLYV